MRYHGHDTARERAIYSKSIAAKKREDGMKRENKFWIRILLGIAGLILFAWLLDNAKVALELLRTLAGILAPFLIGLVIAFVLNVPTRAIERVLRRYLFKKSCPGGAPRAVSLLITLICLCGIGVLLSVIILPELGRTLAGIGQQIPAFFQRVQQKALGLEAWGPQLRELITSLQLDWKKIADSAMGFLQNGATSILDSTMSIATSVFSGVFNFFMGFIFALYLLFDKEHLGVQARRVLYAWLPVERADRVVYITALTERTFSRVLTGQCLEAIILGMMFFVSMSLIGLPYAMLVAMLVAVTALIPMFGAFIGCFVGAFLILVVDPMQALWFVVLFLVLQQIEGNLIYPRVVGSSIGLPAMWVMVAVTVGGSTMGILGMLLMVPAASVIYALSRENTARRLIARQVPGDRYAERKKEGK